MSFLVLVTHKNTCHITRLSHHTYEWVMAHIWMTHGTYKMSHGTHMNRITCQLHHSGITGLSIARGEVNFVLLKLDFLSTLGGQVCNCVLVPAKTGWLIKASLSSVFPVNHLYPIFHVNQERRRVCPSFLWITDLSCESSVSDLSCESAVSVNQPILYQSVARDIKMSRPNSIICCFCAILQFPVIFSFNALPWFDAAPTAWYKRGRFTGKTGYKLALISQPVFSCTRTKLQTCSPKVE